MAPEFPENLTPMHIDFSYPSSLDYRIPSRDAHLNAYPLWLSLKLTPTLPNPTPPKHLSIHIGNNKITLGRHLPRPLPYPQIHTIIR